MNWKALDIIQIKPMLPKERGEPVQRVIEEVFMVNRVEFAMLNQIQRVSKFKNRDAGRLQKPRKPGDKIVDVVYVSNHVVRNHDIGELAFARQLFGASRPKEIVHRRHADARLPALQAHRPDRYRGRQFHGRQSCATNIRHYWQPQPQNCVDRARICEASASTCSAECFNSAGEDEEKYG